MHVERDKTEGYLAQETLTTGLAFAVFIDEFNHNPIVFLEGAERMVHRFIVIETAPVVERKGR